MRISDWSSDVCSSDLRCRALAVRGSHTVRPRIAAADHHNMLAGRRDRSARRGAHLVVACHPLVLLGQELHREADARQFGTRNLQRARMLRPSGQRSEEHTSELQSLMRISYAVFCLKKKTHHSLQK